MADIGTTLATTTSAIMAIGGLGTAAFGLVDATKAFGGGVSNCGFGYVEKALKPFAAALTGANSSWRDTIRANWINGMAKDDQKAAAKSLIRLGLSSRNATDMAAAGHVDATRLTAIMTAVETGAPLTSQDAELLGRFNGAIDAAMDAGFERGDQQYRNACRLTAGLAAIGLAVWAGALVDLSGIGIHPAPDLSAYFFSRPFWTAFLVGLIAVPIAPVAKDLASSLQAAAGAVQAIKP